MDRESFWIGLIILIAVNLGVGVMLQANKDILTGSPYLPLTFILLMIFDILLAIKVISFVRPKIHF